MSAPEYLKERGRAIWEAYDADGLAAANKAMVHELCRMADALDKLDAILGARASEWVVIAEDIQGELTLEVNAVLNERRQHALAFTTMLREIRAAGIEQAAKDSKPKTKTSTRGNLIQILQDHVA